MSSLENYDKAFYMDGVDIGMDDPHFGRQLHDDDEVDDLTAQLLN